MPTSKPYRFLDDVALADVAFEVRGATLERLFENAARAFLEVIVEPEGVKAVRKRTVKLRHEEPGRLLFKFLNELIFLKDTERFAAAKARVSIREGPEGYALEARLAGEPLNEKRHKTRSDAKAVTMHLFEVAKSRDGWVARVVLDI
ncbi:MAG: archease [Halobacteria archaeon]